MVMKKTYIHIIFLLMVFVAKAQLYKPIDFPEKVDKKYILSPIKDEEKYRKKVAKNIPKRYLKSYTYSCAFGKSYLFKDGKIYLSWSGMENYVNQILDSIMPDNLKNKKIHAFIGRNSTINAYCLYDGTMIVNVGLIAEVKNEAALATIMGHELAHYIKNHVLNDYVKKVTERKNKKEDNLALAIKRQGYSQQLELEADELGYDICKKVGYDIEQGLSNFELFIREKEYEIKRKGSSLVNADTVAIKTKAGTYTGNTLEKLLSTHPDEKERKDKLLNVLKTATSTKKVLFKLDEDLFLTLQKQAKLESINLLFNENHYEECLERAFRFHLFAPNELSYMYYVAECIRRVCLMDYTLRKKGFLAEKLVNNGFLEGQGILKDLKYVIPNVDLYAKITAKELLNASQPSFNTYKEAFYYFQGKLIKNDYAEAYLMSALFENNKDKRKSSIDKYLAHPKALHKTYAQNYLNNTLSSSIQKNVGQIVIVPGVDYYSHLKFSKFFDVEPTKYNYGKSELVGNELANTITEGLNRRLSNTKAISLPLASLENFNTKYKYEHIISTSYLAQREENEGYEVTHYYKELEDEDYIGKIDVFRLDPETWNFFNKEQISTISYARYTRHLSETDRLLRRPAFYLGIPTLGFTWLLLPFKTAHHKQLELYTYTTKASQTLYFKKTKAYWLNSSNATKMFKKLSKERETYINEIYGTNE
jgi:hypothetical protein